MLQLFTVAVLTARFRGSSDSRLHRTEINCRPQCDLGPDIKMTQIRIERIQIPSDVLFRLASFIRSGGAMCHPVGAAKHPLLSSTHRSQGQTLPPRFDTDERFSRITLHVKGFGSPKACRLSSG